MKQVVIDGHCDALWKMYEDAALDFSGNTVGLDVNLARLRQSNVKIQFFAIYLSERISQPRFDHYLEYIRLFEERIIRRGGLRPIRCRADVEQVMSSENEIGALLTVEGADALQGNPLHTWALFQLGVRMIGITWNYANWAADGILEPRQGGFSRKGKSFIKDCNELGILLDASHLSVASFWDLAAHSTRPFVATHSNARAICSHPRNLDDHQLGELIRRDGRIGITFVPWFVRSGGGASVQDVVRHVERVCSLGGAAQTVLGSDFDGISEWIPELEHAGCYHRLQEELLRHFKEEEVMGFMHGNWRKFLSEQLPIQNIVTS